MAEREQIEATKAVRLAVLALSGELTEAAIRDLLGDATVKSAAEVAEAFNTAHHTVKHTWRPNGMPANKVGQRLTYPLADILVWLMSNRESAAKDRGADAFTKRKREADARTAEAEARIKERKAELVEGEFVPLAAVRSVMKGILNVLRDQIMAVPRQLTPMFPSKFATQWTEEADRLCRNALVAAAETPIDDVLERMNDAEEAN